MSSRWRRRAKPQYALPLYLNHSLENPLATPREGRLAWAAMTDHVLDIWKATAPSLDMIAPDIYMSPVCAVRQGAG